MPNAEMKRNMRDTSDRYPLSKARREVRYLIGKDRLRRCGLERCARLAERRRVALLFAECGRCPEIYARGIGTTVPGFE